MRALPVLVGLVATLAACSGSPEGDAASPQAAAEKSLFQAEIAPLLASNCATCHMTGQEAGNMALIPAKAIESLVGVKSVEAPNLVRVVPGDPDASYVIMKLEGTHLAKGGSGAQMPFGAPPLPKETIAKVRQWIAEGAKP